MRKKYSILLTNDDGFDSKGIQLLYEILEKKYTTIVVAPDSEKSGVGHSFTYKQPLFYNKIVNSYAKEIYSVSGSPADCVKFAVSYLLPTKPDIVISGLNIGENSGISSYYSGTVAAAREGAFWKIKSFAFSICEDGNDYLSCYINLIPEIIEELLLFETFFSNKYFFNINFPSCSPELLKGIKITKQSLAFFDDKYLKVKIDGKKFEKEGFVIYGKKFDVEKDDCYDSRALINNWISITPLSYDSTVHDEIPTLRIVETRFNSRGIKNER
jgi:5'-nucleotidase